MEFKGTKGKWHTDNNTTLGGKNSIIFSEEKGVIITLNQASFDTDEEMIANALLISKAPEMLDIIEELCENLSFQLDRAGVCGEGDGKGRKADVDSYGGTELLQRAKHLIKEATEL